MNDSATYLAPDWETSLQPIDYPDAIRRMEARVADIAADRAHELVWLLEHPPLYTAGTSAQEQDLLSPARFPVYRTGRGGQFTYHGPGQRIAYVMLDLRRRRGDLRAYIRSLEDWIIATLARFGTHGVVREGRVGVWVEHPDGCENKIAAIGVRVRRWVTYHGISINVAPDLEHFSGIVPCGIREHGVTSLRALGVDASLEDVDAVLQETFSETVGRL